MKYKALFLDLDGTTIPNRLDGLPSQKVIEAIGRASQILSVSIATSRPFFLAKPILNRISLSAPCVICSGAEIYDPVKKKIIHDYLIDASVIPQLGSILETFPVKTRVYDGKKEYYFDSANPPARAYTFFTDPLPPNQVDTYIEKLHKISNITAQKIPAWKKGYVAIDITGAFVSKLHGITQVAKILQIDTHEMIGVGDGYNDFPLLMACGLKIAMGNAVTELKAIADFVAPTVEEDGVATVIEKFILSG